MSWLFDFALQGISELFGEAVAEDEPWVRAIAELGCIATLLLVGGLIWLVVAFVQP